MNQFNPKGLEFASEYGEWRTGNFSYVDCAVCGRIFEPTTHQLEEAGWHEGANQERVSHPTCSECD